MKYHSWYDSFDVDFLERVLDNGLYCVVAQLKFMEVFRQIWDFFLTSISKGLVSLTTRDEIDEAKQYLESVSVDRFNAETKDVGEVLRSSMEAFIKSTVDLVVTTFLVDSDDMFVFRFDVDDIPFGYDSPKNFPYCQLDENGTRTQNIERLRMFSC